MTKAKSERGVDRETTHSLLAVRLPSRDANTFAIRAFQASVLGHFEHDETEQTEIEPCRLAQTQTGPVPKLPARHFCSQSMTLKGKMRSSSPWRAVGGRDGVSSLWESPMRCLP